MASQPVSPQSIKPFAPPAPKDLERDEDREARETAEKVRRGKAPTPVGFAVRHDVVGPWAGGQRLGREDVLGHFRGHPEADAFVDRLVGLGALVPFFE